MDVLQAPFQGMMKTDLDVLRDLWPEGDEKLTEGWSANELDLLLPSPGGARAAGDMELRANKLFTTVAQVQSAEIVYEKFPTNTIRRVISRPDSEPTESSFRLVASTRTDVSPIRMAGVAKDASGAPLTDLCPKWKSGPQPWPEPLKMGEDRVINLEPCVFKPDVRPMASPIAPSVFTANAKDRDIVPTPPGANKGITSYLWDFGDGETSTAENPTHSYSDPGQYEATLIVTDDDPVEWGSTKAASGKLTVVQPTFGPALSVDAIPLSQDIPFMEQEDGTFRCQGEEPFVISATAEDHRGGLPEAMTYEYVGLPFGAAEPPAHYKADGAGLTAREFTALTCETVRFVVRTTNANGQVATAIITVDVEVVGQGAYDLASFRITPSALSGFANSPEGFEMAFTPRLEVKSGARDADDLPITPAPWRVEWDFNNNPTDSADFAASPVVTDSGTRAVTHRFQPGRYFVLARSYSSTVPGLFVEAGTTIVVDVGEPTAEITNVTVVPMGTELKPEFEIRFTGAAVDPDGGTPTYHWIVWDSAGAPATDPDGNIANIPDGAMSSVTVSKIDSYTIQLQVMDDDGQTADAQAVKSVMRTQIA
jgi:hypothetical protein